MISLKRDAIKEEIIWNCLEASRLTRDGVRLDPTLILIPNRWFHQDCKSIPKSRISPPALASNNQVAETRYLLWLGKFWTLFLPGSIVDWSVMFLCSRTLKRLILTRSKGLTDSVFNLCGIFTFSHWTTPLSIFEEIRSITRRKAMRPTLDRWLWSRQRTLSWTNSWTHLSSGQTQNTSTITELF